MDFDTLKTQLNALLESIEKIKEALGYDAKLVELKNLEEETLIPGFWEDKEKSAKVVKSMKSIKSIIQKVETIQRELSDARGYFELAEELNDIESFKESQNLVNNLKESIEKLNIETLLSGDYDFNNAILTIHPGAGGTESHDWALMLYRMYIKWAAKSNFEIEVLDMQEGEEAGIKSVSFLVKGDNAYGYLKSENGVHRLVRISPFDANSRRHTSFAAVEVMPEISDDIKLDIRPEDIQMDVYRASGAGGQHVNKTSSAVRLKHIPSGIVVSCQTERSQFQNREYAMRMLRSRLYEKEKQERDAKLANERKSQVGSGDRSEKIRTYNYPQGRITDHRIGLSIYQMEDFLNGNLDEMIDNLIAADRAEKLKGSEE